MVRVFSMKKVANKLLIASGIALAFLACAILLQQRNLAETASAEITNWGLSFQKEGQTPIGNASAEYLKGFNAYFTGDTAQKTIYLTFDCGFENGNTAPILDALKKHNAPATFFVVGHFLETAPDMVQRMQDEGHIVGNHTYHHPDMSKIADSAAFEEEITTLETKFEEITGQKMQKFYRPPQGKYSAQNLKMASDMGYKTMFWSLAYVDWYTDKQPSHQEAFSKLAPRIHPGAILLLHTTSQTNAEILDELLTKYEAEGYKFAPITELVK